MSKLRFELEMFDVEIADTECARQRDRGIELLDQVSDAVSLASVTIRPRGYVVEGGEAGWYIESTVLHATKRSRRSFTENLYVSTLHEFTLSEKAQYQEMMDKIVHLVG